MVKELREIRRGLRRMRLIGVRKLGREKSESESLEYVGREEKEEDEAKEARNEEEGRGKKSKVNVKKEEEEEVEEERKRGAGKRIEEELENVALEGMKEEEYIKRRE
ncbi:hypothetical protein RF55_14802 [Lasius niger]|uniref:Uncharacterized protein n=1 Tax=Lasius niger TaxID=67767 RepID=A0A0J7K798_LASNI|nr:hypothetical protein RF55_14802 [Lasius niger]